MSHKYVSNKAVMKNEGFLAKLGSTLMTRTNPDPLIETKTQSSIAWRKTSDVKARIKTATGTIAIYDDMTPEEIAELEQQATMMAGGSAPELSGVAATAVQTAVLAAGIGQEEQQTTTVATYLVNEDYSPDDSEGLAVVAGQKVILVDKSSPHKRPRLEGDESGTELLDNSAARHKMAVRPKRNHPDPRSRAQEASEDRWVVRDADSGKEGLVPSRFLVLHSQETSSSLKTSLKRSVQQLALEETLVVKKNLMKEIREFKSRKLSSKLLGPSPEDEARGKRTATIRELIETEEEFVKDLEFVMENYYNLMDKQTTPRNIRDHKELIFNNFKFISDFHQNVLIEGVKYHAEVPTMIGRTFLRLERDFDKHAEYCSNEPLAQEFLENNIPVKEYFEDYSQRLGDDKRLQEHLKLPIQRLNDYQLLLRELVKFSSRLGDDTTDLQRAYELMQTIPQRATDAKFITSIEGFKGNLFKLGRLIRHDWFSVKEASEKARDRYLFLFKARILITKVKRIAEDRSVFILKDIIRLPETSLGSLDKPKALEFFHIESLSHPNYPILIEARTPEIRDSWLSGIEEYVVDTASVEDLLFDDELRVLSQDIDEEDAGVVSPVPEVQEFEDLPEDDELSDQFPKQSQVTIEREPSPPHKRQKPETQPLEGVQEAAKSGPEASSQQKAAAAAAAAPASSPKAAEQQAKGLTLEQVEAPEPSVVAEQGQAPTTTTASPPTTSKETQLAEQQDLAEGLLTADASPVSEAHLTDPNACVVKSEKIYPMEIAEAESRRKGDNKNHFVKGGLKGLGASQEKGFAGRATDGSGAGQRKCEVRISDAKRAHGTFGFQGGENAGREISQKEGKIEDLTSVLGEASQDHHDLMGLTKTVVEEGSKDSHTQEGEVPEDTSSTKKFGEIQWEEEVDFWSQWEEPVNTVKLEGEPSESHCGALGEGGSEDSTLGGVQDASIEMTDLQSAQEKIIKENFASGEKIEPQGLEVTNLKMDTATEEKATVLGMNVGEKIPHTGGEEQEEAATEFDFWAERETSPPIRKLTHYANEIMDDGTGQRSSERKKERKEALESTTEDIGSVSKREGYTKGGNDEGRNKNKPKRTGAQEDTRTPGKATQGAATATSESICYSGQPCKIDKINIEETGKTGYEDWNLIKTHERADETCVSQLGSVSEPAASDFTTAGKDLSASRVPQGTHSNPETHPLTPPSRGLEVGRGSHKFASKALKERTQKAVRTSERRDDDLPIKTAHDSPEQGLVPEDAANQTGPGSGSGNPGDEKQDERKEEEAFDDGGFWAGREGSPPLRQKPMLQGLDASVGMSDPATEGTVDSASKGMADSASKGTVDSASKGTVDLASKGTADSASKGTVDSASKGKVDSASKGAADSRTKSYTNNENHSKNRKKEEVKGGSGTKEVTRREKWGNFRSKRNKSPTSVPEPSSAVDAACRRPGHQSPPHITGNSRENGNKNNENILKREAWGKNMDIKVGTSTKPGAIKSIDKIEGSNIKSEIQAPPCVDSETAIEETDEIDFWADREHSPPPGTEGLFLQSRALLWPRVDLQPPGTSDDTVAGHQAGAQPETHSSGTNTNDKGSPRSDTVADEADTGSMTAKDGIRSVSPTKHEPVPDSCQTASQESRQKKLSKKNRKTFFQGGWRSKREEVDNPAIKEENLAVKEEQKYLSKKGSQPSSATENGVSGQPSSATKDDVSGQPLSATKDDVSGQPLSATKDDVSGQPSSATKDDVSGQPSSATKDDVSGQPSSATKNGVASQPSSATKNDVSSQPSSATKDDVSGQPSSATKEDTPVTLPETTWRTEVNEETYDLSRLLEPSHELEDEGTDWIAQFWAVKETSPPAGEKTPLAPVKQDLDTPIRDGHTKGAESHIPSKGKNAESSFKDLDVLLRKGKAEGYPKDVELTPEMSSENIPLKDIAAIDGTLGESNAVSKKPTPPSEHPNVPEVRNTATHNNVIQQCNETKSSEEVGRIRTEASPGRSWRNMKLDHSPSGPRATDVSQRHSVPIIVAPTERSDNPVRSTGKGFSEGNRRDSISRPFLTYEALDLPVFQNSSFQGLHTFKTKGKDVTGSLPILARTADAEKVMQKYRRFRVQLPPDGEEDDVNLDLWFDSDVRQPSPVRVTCFLGQVVDSSLKRKVGFIGARNRSRHRTKGGRSRSTPASSLHGLNSKSRDKPSYPGGREAIAAKSAMDLQTEEGTQILSRVSKGSSGKAGDLARRTTQATHNDLSSAEGTGENTPERQHRLIAKGVKKGSLAVLNRDSTPRGKGATDKGQELTPTPLPSKRPRKSRVMMF